MPSRSYPLFAALIPAVIVVLLPAVAADAACASGHVRFKLSGLDSTASADPFFLAVEPPTGSTSKQFRIEAHGDVCLQWVYVDYTAGPGSADDSDFEARRGTADMYFADHTAPPKSVDVPIKDDAEDTSGVESINVGLSNPQNGGLGTPWAAPMFIVDVDGAGTRFSLDGRSFERREADGAIDIPVFRAGSTAATTVNYTIEGGPGDPVEPDDYTDVTGGSLTFGGGERMKMIRIGFTRDTHVEPSEALAVRLTTAPGGNVVSPLETNVTLHDGAETILPLSRFHHPRHKWQYKKNDYRLREMHIFTEDAGGSSVVRAELALMQKMKNGRCKWWNGKRFRGGKCGERQWLSLPQFEPDFFYYRIPALRASMGKTKVRSYTAFSRATDGAGNIERQFDERRNANTFEVKRTKRRKR